MRALLRGGDLRSIDRNVLRQAPTDLRRGMEAMSGRLILTADALLFQPHVFNLQTLSLSVPLPQIVAIHPCWTRLFGLLPIAPTSLAVWLSDGNQYCFVIGNRVQWLADITSARDALCCTLK